MAGFTESALSKKLDDLNASQQSIQTLSLWLIHHRKHHEAIVKMWLKEVQKGTVSYFVFITQFRRGLGLLKCKIKLVITYGRLIIIILHIALINICKSWAIWFG